MACVLVGRTWIEPVVAGAQIASSFYDTGLLMVVKNYYNHSNASSVESRGDAVQRAISNFYIIYDLTLGLCPLVSAYILARLGDKKHMKITICVPLLGYLISRLFLLLVILLNWPIEVMYGSAALNGLTGGFTTYWAGVMALGSLGSTDQGRSRRLIVIELTYGLAGFFGSLASGHIFIHFNVNYKQGMVLVSCSLACYLFCVVYSLFVYKVPQAGDGSHGSSAPNQSEHETSGDSRSGPQYTEQSERTRLLDKRHEGNSASIQAQDHINVTPSMVITALLFISAILYNLAVEGAVAVLSLFLIKEPLNWGPVDIGYGNAAGYLIFITSFLGVYAFSKCLRDTTMIMIGVASFSAGIFIMTFVRWTFLYYIARAVMLFSLIPLPTLRSSISKQVQGSSYGKVFVILQLALTITGVVTTTMYNKIYQATLNWFSGFCFLLSCVISALSIIPVSIIAYKQSSRPGSSSIPEE